MSKSEKKQTKHIKEQPEVYGDFNRIEIINNIRYELKPSPSVNHQQIVTLLWHALYTTCQQNGVLLVAPIDVYFDAENIFQPDVVFISNERSEIIKDNRIEGPPDLVIEILSPSTSRNDKVLKKAQYERFSVKEYWIADPVHHTIDQFILDNSKYTLFATFADGDALTSPNFSCIRIDLTKIFTAIRR